MDEIILNQSDIEDMVARTRAIEYLNAEREQHLAEAQRCELLATYLQEALTLWLGTQYHINVATEQWHLDLQNKRLTHE